MHSGAVSARFAAAVLAKTHVAHEDSRLVQKLGGPLQLSF